ncbi:hypothetical protein [Mycobacterium kubicae]|uniref:hypothetical protein n=1 Tax=Mycobacterium kubicae TaxID=120959 RepID=UPI00080025E1|nr:hypothetical protein [Mycobacterium kubicae]OBK44744.1 hypothetical protein A5657_03995 [Mycobacterium kubicae]QNI05266.1 hypothetical protein GAN17_02370 [Mycobacterium kubicae]
MIHSARGLAAHYGSHPLHLLTMVSGFALFGYILATATPTALWNPDKWWQSIAVWFAVAVIAHDFVFFPLYALIDWLLNRLVPSRAPSNLAARNHIRVPILGAGLTLLVFLPGIIEQGAPTYQAATGQTQQPYLGRWLLLVAAMFAGSAVSYAIRLILSRRRTHPANAATTNEQLRHAD